VRNELLMNIESNAIPESFEDRRVAVASLSAIRRFCWCVRRELWENRSIYLAPLAVAGVVLFGFFLSMTGLSHKLPGLSALDWAHQVHPPRMPYDAAAGMIMIAVLAVGFFYCLDALHGERRDRSILFWKSLPVSDRTTVLAKTTIPLLIVPLVGFAITVATQFVMLLLNSAVLLASGHSAMALWTDLALTQTSLLLLYHLMTVHSLWSAPLYGWLLLISAWARRAAFLWATVPLLAIIAMEKILFNTAHFAAMLENRISGGGMEAITAADTLPMDPTTHVTLGRFLSSPGLWIGLLITAGFLYAAIELRRQRGPV
jgi:ABC-2 type transport system permease protein